MTRNAITVLSLLATIILGVPGSSTTAHACHRDPINDFRPVWGSTFTGKHNSGARFIDQSFRWSQARIDEFKRWSTCQLGGATYEHDYWTDNDDGLHWGKKVTYWTTSMRDAYLDTRFADKDELAFTIGTTDATKLVAGKLYYSHMHVSSGNAGLDRGKLQGQMGYRGHYFCGGSHCVFAEQTRTIVPAWQIPVPGHKYWSN